MIPVCQLYLNKTLFKRGTQQVFKNGCVVLNCLLNITRRGEKDLKGELLCL